MGHKSVKKIFNRVLEELYATKKIAEVTSLESAVHTFRTKIDIQIMNRNGFREPDSVRQRLIKKHEIMLDYFEKTIGDFFDGYNYDEMLLNTDVSLSECIWICWWQGVDNAPNIVKRCIESIKKNSGNHRVIVITEDNYKDYVKFPKWVEEKKKAGIISRTHYSDILRLSLLAEYGGMWLDSTFFCAKPNIDEYFQNPIWSIKRPGYAHCSVASGNFATYSLKCDLEHRWIFAIIRDFFLYYWEKNDMLIDYLTLDYIIVLAQQKNFRIATAFENIIPNNPSCDELYKILGEPFDEKIWDKLRKNTTLFKLTWKQEFPIEKDGKETFYAKILNGTLVCDNSPRNKNII